MNTLIQIVKLFIFVVISVDVVRVLISLKNGDYFTCKTKYIFLILYLIFAVWSLISLINNKPWTIQFLVMVTSYIYLKREEE